MVAFHGKNGYSAQAVVDAEINGYNDWFLPSYDELAEMYNTVGPGGELGNIYWLQPESWPYYFSSTEAVIQGAYRLNFSDGEIDSGAKNNPRRVRPIRSF